MTRLPPAPINLIYNYMTLQEQINQVKSEILKLKLEQPYHPQIQQKLQELDKLDEQQRDERRSAGQNQ